jgi:hypothetical protein
MDPGFDARVMAALRALPRYQPSAPRRNWWDWLTRSRTVSVSPLGALAAAAAVIVAAVLVVPRVVPDSQPSGTVATAEAPEQPAATTVASDDDSTHVVQFVFVAPTAKSVSLVGDFNNWDLDATPLAAGPGRAVWTVQLRLPNGRHRYAFVVDDSTWAADPAAPPAAGDDFGMPSSVVTVTGSAS